MAARALEFAALTAARTGEVLGARWGEIGLTSKIWTVPADRMKAGREHRVPLSDAALDVLEMVRPLALTTDGKPDRRHRYSPARGGHCRCRTWCC